MSRLFLSIPVLILVFVFTAAAEEGPEGAEGVPYDPCAPPYGELRLPTGGVESDFLRNVPTDGVLLIPVTETRVFSAFNVDAMEAVEITVSDSSGNALVGSVEPFDSWVGNYWNRPTNYYLLWRGEQPFSSASEYSVQLRFDNGRLFDCPWAGLVEESFAFTTGNRTIKELVDEGAGQIDNVVLEQKRKTIPPGCCQSSDTEWCRQDEECWVCWDSMVFLEGETEHSGGAVSPYVVNSTAVFDPETGDLLGSGPYDPTERFSSAPIYPCSPEYCFISIAHSYVTGDEAISNEFCIDGATVFEVEPSAKGAVLFEGNPCDDPTAGSTWTIAHCTKNPELVSGTDEDHAMMKLGYTTDASSADLPFEDDSGNPVATYDDSAINRGSSERGSGLCSSSPTRNRGVPLSHVLVLVATFAFFFRRRCSLCRQR
jgi:hypothetical protein